MTFTISGPPLDPGGWQTVVEDLVNRRGTALTRYAYLLCGSTDDAADLVQDALVTTFGRLRNGLSVSNRETTDAQ